MPIAYYLYCLLPTLLHFGPNFYKKSNFTCSHYDKTWDIASGLTTVRNELLKNKDLLPDSQMLRNDDRLVLSASFPCFDQSPEIISQALKTDEVHTVTLIKIGTNAKRLFHACDSSIDPHPSPPAVRRIRPDNIDNLGFDAENPGDWAMLIMSAIFAVCVWIDRVSFTQSERIGGA